MKDKIIYGNLIIAAFLLLIAGLVGLFRGEIGGYAFLGVMLAIIFINIAVTISIFGPQKLLDLTKRVWIGSSVFILCLCFLIVDSEQQNANYEMGIIMGYPMSFLSMPSGVLGTIISSKIGVIRPSDFFAGNFYDWLVFFSFGYIQWFVVTPFVVNFFKRI